MSYVDGYVLPVPKKNIKKYIQMAKMGERMWRKHGAIDYKECVGDDLKSAFGTTFSKAMKLKKDEIAVFSYIVFKSKAHRNQVNARVMKEIEKHGDVSKEMPFNVKRMVYGGFKTAVGK